MIELTIRQYQINSQSYKKKKNKNIAKPLFKLKEKIILYIKVIYSLPKR